MYKRQVHWLQAAAGKVTLVVAHESNTPRQLEYNSLSPTSIQLPAAELTVSHHCFGFLSLELLYSMFSFVSVQYLVMAILCLNCVYSSLYLFKFIYVAFNVGDYGCVFVWRFVCLAASLLNVKSASQRVNFKVATLVHQSLSGISPSYLADDCRLIADAREWRLRSTVSRTCVVTRTYSTFSDRAFGAAGPGLWNSLPSRLKDTDISYSEFQRSLKTFL